MNEKERKKVKFSLTKFTKKGSFRFVGFGEIDDENLYTKSITKKYARSENSWHSF